MTSLVGSLCSNLAIFYLSSYVILAPKTFRPGLKANINVLILKEFPPGNPVNVVATLFINSIPLASATGQFRAGKK